MTAGETCLPQTAQVNTVCRTSEPEQVEADASEPTDLRLLGLWNDSHYDGEMQDVRRRG